MSTLEIVNPSQNVTSGGNSTWKDWLGITASIGCAIHCAAMPFVIAYLPALGLSFLADESFHKWMALACFVIALIAFVPGLFKHGSWVPVSTGIVGLALITYAAFGLSDECCASCQAAQATSANQADTEAGCCEPGCEECEAEQGKVDSEPACCEECESEDAQADAVVSGNVVNGDNDSPSTVDSNSFWTLFAPWVTPIGGVLLVAAHLLNRRFGYACGCCESQTACESEPQTV